MIALVSWIRVVGNKSKNLVNFMNKITSLLSFLSLKSSCAFLLLSLCKRRRRLSLVSSISSTLSHLLSFSLTLAADFPLILDRENTF